MFARPSQHPNGPAQVSHCAILSPDVRDALGVSPNLDFATRRSGQRPVFPCFGWKKETRESIDEWKVVVGVQLQSLGRMYSVACARRPIRV